MSAMHLYFSIAVLSQVYRRSKEHFRANSGLPGKLKQDGFLTNI